ncbi:MAG: hypothetical protein ACRDRJ_12710 [Streptosporangiaceae bacterium]
MSKQDFQWLLYRPLYMFGNNGNSVSVNYPLPTGDAPAYSDGGKTVTIHMKGWKWSDGEKAGAKPGSGGCSTSAAKCPAVYNFLSAQAKMPSRNASSPASLTPATPPSTPR